MEIEQTPKSIVLSVSRIQKEGSSVAFLVVNALDQQFIVYDNASDPDTGYHVQGPPKEGVFAGPDDIQKIVYAAALLCIIHRDRISYVTVDRNRYSINPAFDQPLRLITEEGKQESKDGASLEATLNKVLARTRVVIIPPK